MLSSTRAIGSLAQQLCSPFAGLDIDILHVAHVASSVISVQGLWLLRSSGVVRWACVYMHQMVPLMEPVHIVK